MAAMDDLAVLANVIAAARFELADRDPEDLPNKLSRAAAATGKRIPPPHQRAILAHLMADEGFRDAVREQFLASDFDDPVGLEYLTDPQAALPKVELAAAEGKVAALEVALEAETLKTTKADVKLAESRARLAKVQEESRQQLSEQTASNKRARAGLEKTARDAEDRADRADASLGFREAESNSKDAEIADLNAKILNLNEKFAKRNAAASSRSDTTRSEIVRDPIEIARLLDSQERKLRTYRKADHVYDVAETDLPALAVPKGLSSSDAEALDALITQGPQRVIIDGYNVAGLVDPQRFSTREARDDVVNRASKLVRETDAAVVVVFDARQSTDGTTTFTSPIGVEVVFEGDTIADDTIATMAREGAERCIVITNDREIHNRVQRTDCVSIFATAFVSWTEHLNRT
jgi:predicted RNA-binding protein with PIN domain